MTILVLIYLWLNRHAQDLNKRYEEISNSINDDL